MVLLNRLRGVKRGSSEENNIIWMLENRITSQAREYYNREGVRELLNMLDENVNRKGYQLSDAVSALLYLPKYNSDGEPLNREEAKKDEWNKKWLEAWRNNNQAVKAELMKEGVVRVLNYCIPSL